jgi:hypothetical protein
MTQRRISRRVNVLRFASQWIARADCVTDANDLG